MFSSSRESLQLMRKILDVQEELDKLRSESSSRHDHNIGKKGRSFSKDSKVSPRMHKLKDENRAYLPKERSKLEFYDDEDPQKILDSKVSKREKLRKELEGFNSAKDEILEEKKHKQSLDHHSKRPPTNPLRHPGTDITNDSQQNFTRNKLRVSIESPHSNVNFNTPNLLAGKTSPRVSPYNKDNTTTKTHLLNDAKNEDKYISNHLTNYSTKASSSSKIQTKNYEQDENINIEYHKKEPIQLTFKNSSKKQNKTDNLRSSLTYSQTHRENLSSNKKNHIHDPLKITTQEEEGLKKKLDFDEDRIQPVKSNNLYNTLESQPKNPRNLDLLQYQSTTSTAKSMFTSTEPTNSHANSKNIYFPSEMPSYASTQQNFETAQASSSRRDVLISQSQISPQRIESSIDLNDKTRVLNIILDLKNKVQARELEILELKNSRTKYDTENQNLLHQIKELLSNNKANEGNIEKLKYQNECQEKEIEFLKKCKMRLEANLHEAGALFDAKESGKVKKYEQLLEEKNKHIKELNDQLNLVKTDSRLYFSEEEKLRMSAEINKLKAQVIAKEDDNKRLVQENEALQQKNAEYVEIEKKIMELSEMQEILIAENDNLKEKLLAKTVKETEDEVNYFANKDVSGQLLVASKKLKEIEEYSKRLIKILQAAVSGQEPPIELILKHNRATREREISQAENELKSMTVKQISGNNMALIENLHKSLIVCMDQICDTYAIKYGNECNVQ